MKTTVYLRSVTTTAMMGMILLMASIISVAPALFKQTAIATVDKAMLQLLHQLDLTMQRSESQLEEGT